jgi:Membrane-fusion protein
LKVHKKSLKITIKLKKVWQLILGGKLMKKRLIKALTACLIIGTAFASGYNKFYVNRAAATTNNSKIVTAKKMDMQVGIQGTGSVYAAVSKDISANNSGVLKDLNVKVGDTVEAGSKLFVSDSDDLRQSLSDAQANLDKQKLALANDSDSYNNSIAKANAAVTDAQAALNNAKDQLNKTSATSLVTDVVAEESNNGASRSSSSSRNLDRESSVSNSSVLKQNVEKAQSNLDKQNAALAALKNSNKLQIDSLNVSDAQIGLNSAQDAVNKMTVTAPIGGLVIAVNNSNGDNVSASGGSAQGGSNTVASSASTQTGSKSSTSMKNSSSSGQNSGSNSGQTNSTSSSQSNGTIITIIDPTSLKVKVAVDELDMEKIQVGQKAQIRFDASSDKVYEGTVEAIPQTGTTTNNVTTYDVVVSIDNPKDIKIGMSANVNILVDSKADTLVIPADALIEKDSKKYVMDENKNLIEVRTGIENENYIEILEGVTDGETLIESSAQSNDTTSSSK